MDLWGCGETLLAVVAIRKRGGSSFLAQPDGQHGLGRVLHKQHSFSAAC